MRIVNVEILSSFENPIHPPINQITTSSTDKIANAAKTLFLDVFLNSDKVRRTTKIIEILNVVLQSDIPNRLIFAKGRKFLMISVTGPDIIKIRLNTPSKQ